MPNPDVLTTLCALRRLSYISGSALHSTPPPASANAASLTAASKSLRSQIVDAELAITTLLATPSPAASAPDALIRAHTATATTPGYIPPVDSPLPTLLAYRVLATVIANTTASVAGAQKRLTEVCTRLDAMRTMVAEQEVLEAALTRRLEGPVHNDERGGGGGGGVEKLQTKEVAIKHRRALKTLVAFVGDVLAPMLEIEEAGGAAAGTVAVDAVKPGNKTQRTIREMWKGERERGGGVGRECMELIETLMNASVDGMQGGWIRLEREGAAVRFLVRAGVAVMDRRDARRIRLVEFGTLFE